MLRGYNSFVQTYRGERLTEAFRHLTGPSGGLLYHLTALRYRKTQWQDFLQSVDLWLRQWRQNSSSLLLFGASAGWTLPAHIFSRYQRVSVVEPDPLARFILKRRFPEMQNWLFYDRVDLLPWFTSDRNLFSFFLRENSDADILFSNILGQIPLLLPQALTPTDHHLRQREFMQALQHRNWASYHDLLSSSTSPVRREPLPRQKNFNLEKIAEQVFAPDHVVTDHEMGWLSQELETDLAIWEIRPSQFHLTAFVKSKTS
jgi:hypothetical protein